MVSHPDDYQSQLDEFFRTGGSITKCPPRKAAGHLTIPPEKLLVSQRPPRKRTFPSRKKTK